jgi:hypothetical protein
VVGKVDKVDNLGDPRQGSIVMATTLEKREGKAKLPAGEQAMVD